MTGAQYAAASRQLLPVFKRGELRVGPILNGWLLDRQQDLFASYCPEDLFGLWDWFGIDTYETGSLSSPGKRKPADRHPCRCEVRDRRGPRPAAGRGRVQRVTAGRPSLLPARRCSAPPMSGSVACGTRPARKGVPLTGDRLAAFQATLADPRAGKPRRV